MFDSKKLPQLMYALHTIIVQMKSEATQTNHRELADFLKTFEDLPLLLASNQDETEAIRQLIINAVQVDCMSTRALDAFDEEEPPLLKLGQIERDAMIREDKYRHAMYALHVFFVSMENNAGMAGDRRMSTAFDYLEIIPEYILEKADKTESIRELIKDLLNLYPNCSKALELLDQETPPISEQ